MRVKVLGCGDAFGSGGRFNTCFLVDRGNSDNILIDCGASAMISIRRFEVDPNAIAAIVLSHLHADHFGGLPSFILDALVSRRTRPLIIAGPRGLPARLEALMEAHFPGSSKAQRKFPVNIVEMEPGSPTRLEALGVAVSVFEVKHPSGTPSLALRLDCDGKMVAYTGDTEWVDALSDAGRHADLFIAEAYTYERNVPYHLSFTGLRDKLPLIEPRQVLLTHMSPDMLSHVSEIGNCIAAEDGLIVEL